jgi:hypothetical protein
MIIQPTVCSTDVPDGKTFKEGQIEVEEENVNAGTQEEWPLPTGVKKAVTKKQTKAVADKPNAVAKNLKADNHNWEQRTGVSRISPWPWPSHGQAKYISTWEATMKAKETFMQQSNGIYV